MNNSVFVVYIKEFLPQEAMKQVYLMVCVSSWLWYRMVYQELESIVASYAHLVPKVQHNTSAMLRKRSSSLLHMY
jgi:hypothetical protein